MAVQEINRLFVNEFEKKLAVLVEDLAKQYGIRAKVGPTGFTPANATFRIQLAVINSKGVAETKEAQDFRILTTRHGLPASALGEPFFYKNTQYRIVGYLLKSSAYPILVERVMDGKEVKMSIETVKGCLAG